MWYSLLFMMDYAKTREEAKGRKQQLTLRALAIVEEKKKLDSEVEKIKRELIGLDQILDGVEFMTSEVPPDLEPSGFTDKIRKILSETSVPLVPTQIRDALEASGTTGSSSRNLLISVHTVLERIKSELEGSTTSDGKTAYKRNVAWTPSFGLAPYGPWNALLKTTPLPELNKPGNRMTDFIKQVMKDKQPTKPKK